MKKILVFITTVCCMAAMSSCNYNFSSMLNNVAATTTAQDEAYLLVMSKYDRYPAGVSVSVDGDTYNIKKVYSAAKAHKTRLITVTPGAHRVVIRDNVSNEVIYDRKLFVGHRNTQKIDLP